MIFSPNLVPGADCKGANPGTVRMTLVPIPIDDLQNEIDGVVLKGKIAKEIISWVIANTTQLNLRIYKKVISLSLALMLAAVNFSVVHAMPAQSLESFENEFEWINIKTCKRPAITPPPPILIKPPTGSKGGHKKISIRRWLDEDGDGLCEVYDVQELEKSYYTGKIYGYPYRASRYESGKWSMQDGSTGRWLPLILLDKVTGTRLNIFYAYGKAGYTEGGAGPQPDCESMRTTLAEGYMLLFKFPKFAKEDPAMDPDGVWNNYISGWINSQYPEKSILLESPVSDECKHKYRLVIDAIYRKLGN